MPVTELPKAASKTQRRLFGMVQGVKDGTLDINTLPKSLQDKINKLLKGYKGKTKFVKGVPKRDIKSIATTKEKKLPEVKENYILTFDQFINEKLMNDI
jgi:hypothetical protein